MFLIFDTETTGLPKNDNAPLTDFDNWPRMVQLAWQIHDDQGRFVENHNYLVQPEGFEMPIAAKMVHGISTEHAMKYGKPLNEVLDIFMQSAAKAKYLVGHNIKFDLNVLGCEFLRSGRENPLRRWQIIDTCFANFRAAKMVSSSSRNWKKSTKSCLVRSSTRHTMLPPMWRPRRVFSSNWFVAA